MLKKADPCRPASERWSDATAEEIAKASEADRKKRTARRSNLRVPVSTRDRVTSLANDVSSRSIRRAANEHFAFLAQCWEITGDPAFSQAMTALDAYGLAGNLSGRLTGIETEVQNADHLLTQRVDLELERQKKAGDRASAANAYREIAASCQLPFESRNPCGDGLDTAAARVKRAHKKALEEQRHGLLPLGDTGNRLSVIEATLLYELVPDKAKLAKAAHSVPDNREWRRKVASGRFVKLK